MPLYNPPVPGPKGDDGPKGDKGLQGDNGDTPVKGVDYFDGEAGAKGADGLPGSDANVTKVNVEAVLTGEISSHSHAGGAGGLSQPQTMARGLGC